MSSVQGSSVAISSGAIERVKTLLDEIDGKAALTNLSSALALRQQLERNVTSPATAAALVEKLSGTQRDALREVLPSLPTVKAFFKDAFDRAPGPQDNVMSAQHGLERNVRDSRGTSEKVNDGRTIDVAAIHERLDEEPSGSSARRTRRPRRGEESEVVPSAGPPQATRINIIHDEPGAAEGPQAVDGIAPKARKVGAPAASAGPASATVEREPVAPVDGAPASVASTTASGAPADVDPEIHAALDQTIDFIKQHLSPRGTQLHREAVQIQEKLQRDSAEFDGYRKRHAELRGIPKAKRSTEEKAELRDLETKLRGAPDLKKLESDFRKIVGELEGMPNHVGLLGAWFGLEKNRPALDDDTTEGRRTLQIFDELAGRETNLPPDIKARIAEFRQTEEGKRLAALEPNMELTRSFPESFAKAFTTGEVNTGHPVLDNVVMHVLGGHLFREDDVRKLLTVVPSPSATAAAASAGGAPPRKPPSGSASAGPSGPSGPPTPPNPQSGPASAEDDKWFNAANRNWFGLSRVRHDQLKNDGHHELLHAIQEYNAKTQQMHLVSATRLNSMMALLNSGLPIESILLMFMGMMTENEEDKLRLKMAEIVVAEQFERTNRKLQADQNFARDLVKKYDAGIDLGEHRENINREQLDKMAGLTWTPHVSAQEAAESNARGNAFKTLRADGMDKLSAKLDKIQFKDGALDAEGLKELGLTADELKTAGIHNETELNLFKGQAAAHSDEHIDDLVNKREVKREARFVDVTLNPMDFGFTTKPSQAIVQELQVQMQNYKQMMETFTAVIRMLQDIVARITQNIR